jgi:hypothetical protein
MGKIKRALYIAFAAFLAASCYPFNLSLKSTGSGLTNTAHAPDPVPGITLVGAYTEPYTITYYDDDETTVTVNLGDSAPTIGETIKSITTIGDAGREILIGRPDTDSINLNVRPDGSLAFRDDEDSSIPIPIGSYAEFQLINTDTTTLAGSYKQEADLDLMRVDWAPVGKDTGNFTGTFDGDGKDIKNLLINMLVENQVGLFGVVQGTVENVHVRSGNVTGHYNVGGVAGSLAETAAPTIRLCSNGAAITGESGVGGIVGFVGSPGNLIIGCYNTGTVTGTDNGVGGIIGVSTLGKIIACYNTGEVMGYYDVGGVLGLSNAATVITCYNTGSVSGKGEIEDMKGGVGGVVGYFSWDGEMTACYSIGAITVTSGDPNLAGGVSGRLYNHTNMHNNYWFNVLGDNAEYGIGYNDSSPFLSNTDAAPFSDSAWPSDGDNLQWGIGASDGSGDGTYWKTLGSWNGGDPIYPKLWFEKDDE